MRMFNYLNPKPLTINLDMDGLFADFNKHATNILKKPVNLLVEGDNTVDWRKIESHPRFYRDIPVFEESYELMKVVQDQMEWYNIAFLTATPFNHFLPWVHHDKVEWAQEHFPGIPVFFGPNAKDKQKHAKKGDILIDDRLSNCVEWNAVGGIAVRHIGNYQDTINQFLDIVHEQKRRF